jgi:hypothetical protein
LKQVGLANGIADRLLLSPAASPQSANLLLVLALSIENAASLKTQQRRLKGIEPRFLPIELAADFDGLGKVGTELWALPRAARTRSCRCATASPSRRHPPGFDR